MNQQQLKQCLQAKSITLATSASKQSNKLGAAY
jgi:hypothetical protein